MDIESGVSYLVLLGLFAHVMDCRARAILAEFLLCETWLRIYASTRDASARARKVGQGSLRLGIRQPCSHRRTLVTKNQRATENGVDKKFGATFGRRQFQCRRRV